ncbi:MAG: hypothetical protein ACRC10_02380 [Thermoguttaceae bacterium]
MQKQRNKSNNRNNCTNTASEFENHVRHCEEITEANFCPGLGALTDSDKSKVKQGTIDVINGSVNLENALEKVRQRERSEREKYPKCCDYMIGFTKDGRGRIVFIEIHGAIDGEIKNVVEKFDFIKRWLRAGGQCFDSVDNSPKFCWVASGRSSISPKGRQKLEMKGVSFKGNCLTLDTL